MSQLLVHKYLYLIPTVSCLVILLISNVSMCGAWISWHSKVSTSNQNARELTHPPPSVPHSQYSCPKNLLTIITYSVTSSDVVTSWCDTRWRPVSWQRQYTKANTFEILKNTFFNLPTLTFKLSRVIVKVNFPTKVQVCTSNGSPGRAFTETHTHRFYTLDCWCGRG